MFRSNEFREALLTARQQPYVDFDPAFYERLKTTGLQAKLCWDAECQHLANNEEQIMLSAHWPQSWETHDLAEYRSNMLHGREACEWIVKTLNGSEPAAIWGLSDGDVAWRCYDALARELKEAMKAEGPNAPDYLRWLKFLSDTSGMHDEDRDELWPLFNQAARNSPLVRPTLVGTDRTVHAPGFEGPRRHCRHRRFRLRPQPQTQDRLQCRLPTA